MMSRLPQRVRLLGYRLAVKQVPSGELARIAKDARPMEGLWDDETRTIYIWKRLSQKDKQRVFLHELSHALIDVANWNSQ